MSEDDDRDRREREPRFPLLFEPAKPSLTERMLSPLKDLFGGADDPARQDAAEPARARTDPPEEATGEGDDAGREPPSARTSADARTGRAGADTSGDASDRSTEAAEEEAGPVQRATIQLLPGRLEPLDPEIVRQEVRFLRSGASESVVTLGWEVGEPPAHVTLDHPSILPRHARMRFRDGEWTIESLSDEDLVEVNGEPLPVDDWPRTLRSGDVIRIGEAVFRFHER